MQLREPLYRVVIIDPITREEIRELGLFCQSYAREVIEEYRRITADDQNETLAMIAHRITRVELLQRLAA